MPSVHSLNLDDEKKEVAHNEMSRKMDYDERAATLRTVRAADPGLKPLSWRGLQFLFYVLVICACTGDTGKSVRRDGPDCRL